jgi:hypothetical protein
MIVGKQLRMNDVVAHNCRLDDGSTAIVCGHFRGVDKHKVNHVFFEPTYDFLNAYGTVNVSSITKLDAKHVEHDFKEHASMSNLRSVARYYELSLTDQLRETMVEQLAACFKSQVPDVSHKVDAMVATMMSTAPAKRERKRRAFTDDAYYLDTLAPALRDELSRRGSNAERFFEEDDRAMAKKKNKCNKNKTKRAAAPGTIPLHDDDEVEITGERTRAEAEAAREAEARANAADDEHGVADCAMTLMAMMEKEKHYEEEDDDDVEDLEEEDVEEEDDDFVDSDMPGVLIHGYYGA